MTDDELLELAEYAQTQRDIGMNAAYGSSDHHDAMEALDELRDAADPATIIDLIMRLREAKARAMPVLPENWRITDIHWHPTLKIYTARIENDATRLHAGATGDNPTEAIARAVSYAIMIDNA